MKKKALMFGLLVMALTLLPVLASASLLDFNISAPTTGSIAYTGGAAPLVGVDIQVDDVVGTGTAHAGVNVGIVGGLLNFTTGNFSSYDVATNTWTFSGGGTITVTGTIPGIAPLPDPTNPLLSGTFTSATVQGIGPDFKVSLASFTDIKDPGLLRYFGYPDPPPPFGGFFNISFLGTGVGGGAIASTTMGSGDIFNQPIPEPASMILMGSGLFGFAGWARKKIKI